MLKFQYHYLLFAAIIFVIEVLIALYVQDGIIRPYIGDFLVVILIYCFFKSFLNLSVWAVAVGVLLFSYTIEVLQYFKIVELLHLQGSKLASTIIGTSFSWTDMLAYTLGVGFVLLVERIVAGKRMASQMKST
ncbi:MAG: DUF2809 domain-containing protein [Saprospiraceae bacterium]|nr:DUF2809 domain-containing protein [Saprospiraceae bacterium]